jgi:putative ABC transport system ATP-binding protein
MVTHDPELAARAERNVHIIDGQVTDFDDEPRLARPAHDDNHAAVATA